VYAALFDNSTHLHVPEHLLMSGGGLGVLFVQEDVDK
jgi:hypothetical protein